MHILTPSWMFLSYDIALGVSIMCVVEPQCSQRWTLPPGLPYRPDDTFGRYGDADLGVKKIRPTNA